MTGHQPDAAGLEDAYPLAPIQQGMLFHHVFAQQPGVDIEQIVGLLPEALDLAAFEDAWRAVAARHPVLRTSFRWHGLPEPVQEVHRHVEPAFARFDWRDLPAAEQEARWTHFLAADRQRGFDLAAPPLVRVTTARTGEADYRFVWTFPHILLDGRSFPQVLDEVFAIYEAAQAGQVARLPAPRPYRDHIDWLAQQELAGAEGFWRRLLAGFSAPTPLPPAWVDGAAARQPAAHRQRTTCLSAATTAALRDLAAAHGLSLNTFVQGAWALVLGRHSGEEEVVFGATRAGRRSSVEGADSIVGVFINTLPLRVRLTPEMPLLEWLAELRAQQVAVRPYEQTPLVKVQAWSDLPAGASLFDSILVFENYLLGSAMRARGGAWANRTVELLEETNYPLTLYGYGEPELLLKLAYDPRRFDDATIDRLLGHLTTALISMATRPDQSLATIDLLTPAERQQLLVEWNATATAYPRAACIHGLIAAQAARTPDAPAVIFEDQRLTYRELDERANQLAHYLRGLGVRVGSLVGISVERSLEMMVGLLGILKAGAAYVPLDPAYPAERLAFMRSDAGLAALLTQQHLRAGLPADSVPVVSLDGDWSVIARQPTTDPASPVTAEDLAYVMYTSGSTGRPKGVMVSHRNVVNFFAGMDERLPRAEPGVWLAVTSISFDISVLELFWTLARGLTVVVQVEERAVQRVAAPDPVASRPIAFSLFYFASASGKSGADKYRLLLEGARFADEHGFAAVWTPERHFHEFGGLYPNPSVTSAALATITKRVHLRAGSVVLPLQNPLRVTEEWSVVDNLSGGRVGVSYASGWHADDFALAPDNFANRHTIMRRDIDTVRQLWRGEAVPVRNGVGKEITVRVHPRPVQPDLPIWITAAGSPETFRLAGELGANLLTHLLGQSLDDLAEKIRLYRQARLDHGHDPAAGIVTLMMHTFVGDDLATVRETVRQPFIDYLKTSAGLVRSLARSLGQDLSTGDLSEADMEAFLHQRFDHFFEHSGLMGTPESCLAMVNRLKAIDVDEVACLIDFGVPEEATLAGLRRLAELQARANARPADTVMDFTLPAQIRRHGVTHFQCTPSLASILLASPTTAAALKPLRAFLVGGEALPGALAARLRHLVDGPILNMYGPTETTIWSTTHRVTEEDGTVPIGRPIANTSLAIVDRHLRPVPVGVPGELLIGGDGVSQGYLNRPELTAERFVEAPFAQGQGRFYRTGDLARYRPDGVIEFLGRLDHQVKIRGHRIELGEIEAALRQHAAVREAVVIAREDVPGDTRLVAYVIPATPSLPASADLRAFLAARLPDPMLPAAFVGLVAFPLTPNGKIDRKALPAPDLDAATADATYVAPRTETERQLAEIWQRVLHVNRVGALDDYFLLGGHSLLAIHLISEIRETFKVDLPLRSLFQTPTVAGLAATILQLQIEQADADHLATLLADLESLSDEEVQALLAR